MSLVLLLEPEEKVGYQCDRCGAVRDYLSDSWSEIYLFNDPDAVLHHCLPCRSDKREWTG